MKDDLKPYLAIVWRKEPAQAGERLKLFAGSLDEAAKMIEEQFGEGVIYSLYNEEDADQPR